VASDYGVARFGLKGVAAVIENKIQELGGEARVESISDRAARLQRSKELERAKEHFRSSAEGVSAANVAVSDLITALERRITEIVRDNESLKGLALRKISDYWLLHASRFCVVIEWWSYTNTLNDSVLRAEVYRGVPHLPGLLPGLDDPRLLQKMQFDYQLINRSRHGFVERNSFPSILCGSTRRPLASGIP
jgi:hypothetical protein